MGNTFTSSLPFEIGETQYQLENWVLHEGKRKSDNSKVSIFLRKIEQTTQRTAIYLATNGYHNIRITHHPDFLQYLEGDENEQMIYYITEPAIPLNQVLNNLTFDEKIWGIYKLATALEFLNSSCKIIHGSLDSSNIFVTEGGDWKLGTLDHSIKFDELSQQDLANKLNRLKYQPPEIESRAINQIKQSPIHAIDSYCLGCFLTEILSTVQFGGKNNNIFYSAHQIKKLFKGSQIENIDELIKIISGLTASNPTDRISPETAIKSDFFQNNSYFISLNFLESIALKSEHERESFFKKIPTLISKIPEKVSKQKLLPILLEQLKLTNNVKVLRPVLIITSLLTQEEYTTMIAPVILKLFSSMNRSIRIGLLENLPDYIKFLSKQDINGVIFNNIINGFTDSAPLLRELTLKCMVHFAPSLNEQNLDNKAVRLISKLQMDPEPGIRTNSIICLGKIAQYLKQSTKEQILIPVFLRSLKDPFSPSRINSLKALLATKDSYSFSSSARKLLPSVCVVLADPDFEVRKMGAVVVKAFVEMLEQESVKIHEKELSQPENSENKSSLMGWVQQKLRRGEETKNSPNPNLNQNENSKNQNENSKNQNQNPKIQNQKIQNQKNENILKNQKIHNQNNLKNENQKMLNQKIQKPKKEIPKIQNQHKLSQIQPKKSNTSPLTLTSKMQNQPKKSEKSQNILPNQQEKEKTNTESGLLISFEKTPKKGLDLTSRSKQNKKEILPQGWDDWTFEEDIMNGIEKETDLKNSFMNETNDWQNNDEKNLFDDLLMDSFNQKNDPNDSSQKSIQNDSNFLFQQLQSDNQNLPKESNTVSDWNIDFGFDDEKDY
ncbi:n-terminal kinase-like protein [Anaeramoeba ignava]|uniref:N-terminal kinase-like protein n=1 Tax=Anaeramoeba ignava TaxID=1746090 RepID=A0A9Q0RGE5_ANAIG|nr:n-terminal kinase-like protein [Anaeramoeba ignava]